MRTQGEILQKRSEGIDKFNLRDIADELHAIFCTSNSHLNTGEIPKGPLVSLYCDYFKSNWTDKMVNKTKEVWFLKAGELVAFAKGQAMTPEKFKELLAFMSKCSGKIA